MEREIKFRAWDSFNREMIDYFSIDEQGWLFSSKTNSPFVMQFTGLRDKNGKEIYEGDILDDPTLYPLAVVWDKENTGFGRRDHDGDHYITSLCEVVGNIYENPDLLSP